MPMKQIAYEDNTRLRPSLAKCMHIPDVPRELPPFGDKSIVLETWDHARGYGVAIRHDTSTFQPFALSYHEDWDDCSLRRPWLFSNLHIRKEDNSRNITRFLDRATCASLDICLEILYHPIPGFHFPSPLISDVMYAFLPYLHRCQKLAVRCDKPSDWTALCNQSGGAPLLSDLTLFGDDDELSCHFPFTFAPNLKHLRVESLSVNIDALVSTSLTHFIGLNLPTSPIFTRTLINTLSAGENLEHVELGFKGPSSTPYTSFSRRKITLPKLTSLTIRAKPIQYYEKLDPFPNHAPLSLSNIEAPSLIKLTLEGFGMRDVLEPFCFPSVTDLNICDAAGFIKRHGLDALSYRLPSVIQLETNYSLTNDIHLAQLSAFPLLKTAMVDELTGSHACIFGAIRRGVAASTSADTDTPFRLLRTRRLIDFTEIHSTYLASVRVAILLLPAQAGAETHTSLSTHSRI